MFHICDKCHRELSSQSCFVTMVSEYVDHYNHTKNDSHVMLYYFGFYYTFVDVSHVLDHISLARCNTNEQVCSSVEDYANNGPVDNLSKQFYQILRSESAILTLH